MIRVIKIFSVITWILAAQSCSQSLINNRVPSGIGPSTCNELLSAVIKDSPLTPDSQSINLIKLIDEGVTTPENIQILLQSPVYKKLIFASESADNLENSALIVELISKTNPNWTPLQVTKRYKLLFHTCGI
jgi:hypothetical protein